VQRMMGIGHDSCQPFSMVKLRRRVDEQPLSRKINASKFNGEGANQGKRFPRISLFKTYWKTIQQQQYLLMFNWLVFVKTKSPPSSQ
ncbi:MAG: hypothetical protein AAF579_23775, partial [Cyanobacteria bacterium P01_C01_bin.118]